MLESSTEKEISLSSHKDVVENQNPLSGSRNMCGRLIEKEELSLLYSFVCQVSISSPSFTSSLHFQNTVALSIEVLFGWNRSRRSDPPVQNHTMRILSMRSKARGIPSIWLINTVGLQQSVIDLITVIKYNKRRDSNDSGSREDMEMTIRRLTVVGVLRLEKVGLLKLGLVYWQLKKQGLMRFEEQIEPVRRSVSMDLSAASEIYLAMANAVPVEHEGTSDMRSVPGKKLNLRSLQGRGSTFMKKSLSSFPCFHPDAAGAGTQSFPCEDEALTLLLFIVLGEIGAKSGYLRHCRQTRI
ncbi:hypothetical protein CK203_113634 [Vitis vinifera]|uniref:Uncharacterized protein n=1 Tax=Vitis vinifera TaxID=29760 RepID=A0A438C5Z9_VITVI|nr:hypothetical protein CK203_113634 [Vitis vinifera]